MKKTLSELLKEIRIRKNLTVRQAAQLVGVCYSTYCGLENGKTPSYITIKKISVYMGITEEELRGKIK